MPDFSKLFSLTALLLGTGASTVSAQTAESPIVLDTLTLIATGLPTEAFESPASTSDSLSSDGRGFRRRSVSRRNEERPLMSPDEVKKLDASKVILIPERQNPILADRIVYYEDPYFSKIMAAQSGPLPYPDERHQIRSMRDEIEKLQDQVAQFRPLAYAPPAGITAKAVIAEVEAARPAMTDAEAREALRPSDKEAIRKASDFRKKMKAKVPAE